MTITSWTFLFLHSCFVAFWQLETSRLCRRYTYWYSMYVVIIGMTLVVVTCIVQSYAAINEIPGLLTGRWWWLLRI